MAAGLGAGALVLTTNAVAAGKSAIDSAYGYDRTWNAALRLVKVDLALKVTEADQKNGFLLFDYRSIEGGSKPTTGSFELIRTGVGSVHVVAQIPAMPTYHERMLLDRLGQKMHEEYGDPPEPRPQAPPPPADAGPDADDDNGGN
jgi:hypothetical protein